MPSATITGRVEGLGPTLDRMKGLKVGVRNRALKRGVTKVSRRVAKAAKANVRTKTGKNVLKKSIGAKVYMKGGTVVAIVGPRKGFKQQVGVRFDGSPIFEDPAKVSHLKEFGRAAVTVTKKTVLSDGRVILGKSVTAAPADPFMRPGWDAERPNVLPTIAQEVEVEIQKQAAKGH